MDIYGILAHPAHQSLSPAIHNAAFKKLGIDAEYRYFDVPGDDLSSFMIEMRDNQLKGLSVSTPHKEVIGHYLDKLDPACKEIGAVNCVYFRDGKYHGENTDWIGIKEPIEAVEPIEGKRVVILGAGGAARAAIYAMKQAKAGSITILNRTVDHAHDLAKEFQCEFGSLEDFGKADIVIQATSAGLNDPKGVQIIPKEKLNINMVIFEMIYSPKETQIIKDAKEIEARIITGEQMLLHQGYAAFELWTQQKAPRKVMEQAIAEGFE